jgi:hypothetical protein
MLKQIIVAENPLDPSSWESHFTTDIRDFLVERYGEKFPDTGRIYHGHVSVDHDVTPHDERGIERLGELHGPFYVVIYPHDPITVIIAVVAVAAVAVAVSLALTPPVPSLRNTQSESPNNELSARENRARVGGRIPEIFGTVTSTPDLIAVPYKEFISHQEVEYAYMCIGRGTYAVDADSIRDGETIISEIAGASIAVYGPGTSPNSGTPQLTVGSAIGEPVLKSVRSNAVNGQELPAPDANSFNANANTKFVSPNQIVTTASGIDFTEKFTASSTITVSNATYSEVTAPGSTESPTAKFTSTGTIVYSSGSPGFTSGDIITVSNAFFITDNDTFMTLDGTYTISSVNSTTITLSSPSSVNSAWGDISTDFVANETYNRLVDITSQGESTTVNLAGTYTVSSVTSDTISLSSPSSVNSDWNDLTDFTGNETGLISPYITSTGIVWIGPFTLDVSDLESIYLNFVALNGLYKDDGEQQYAFNVSVTVEATPVDANGTPTGPAQTTSGTVQGSSTTKSTRALTIKFTPTFTGRCKVRVRRTTNSDTNFEGTVVDTLKWRDLYAMSPVSETDFGDVTTVHSVTYATDGALALKSRKLNMDVTRKIPTRISGDQFTTALTATNSADEIMAAIALDPKIGNRQKAEIDFDSIYDTVQAVKDYFGVDEAGEFNYTFDSDNFSFEETMSTIATAIFSTAYRRGNVLKLAFEKATQNSSLLFNHRNKLPGTESRTVQFGGLNEQDGVEYEYVDEADGSLITLTIPYDNPPDNPRKVESVGVRNYPQAYFQAWRIWNKIQYQNILTEFEGTQEADLLVLNERILVADNTRTGTQDGDVFDQDNLTLTLSQDITFEVGETYTIFLQHVDGTIESIGVTAGSEANQVTLATAPRATLSTDSANYARATFQIVKDSSSREQAFLVSEKKPRDNFTSTIAAINYADEYYLNDELLLWLPFGPSGMVDRSAHLKTLSPQGTATTTTDDVRGVVYSSGASTGYLNLNLTATASYSKVVWVNLNTAGDNGNIMSTVAIDEYFYYDGSQIKVQHYNSTLGNDNVGVAYPGGADEWVHVAATYDADDQVAKIYINGALAASEGSFNQRSNLSTLQIGAFANGTTWNGKMDDFRYYKKALTAAEILKIYRQTLV